MNFEFSNRPEDSNFSKRLFSRFSSSIVICDLIYFPIVYSRPTLKLRQRTFALIKTEAGIASCQLLFNRCCTRRNHAPVALHQTHQITPPSQPFWFSRRWFSLRRVISTLITSNLSYAFLHNRGLSIVLPSNSYLAGQVCPTIRIRPGLRKRDSVFSSEFPTSFRV